MVDRLLHMRGGGIVVAGEHDAALMAGSRDRGTVGWRISHGFANAAVTKFVELLIGELELALVVVSVGLEIDELPLPRRMVHQRSQANAFVIFEIGKAFEAIGRGHLAAQMDEMIGAQPVMADAVLDRVGELAHIRRGHLEIVVEADAQCVEDSGDAGGGNLGVMREHCGEGVPAYLGARRIVPLKMVGMQFDQAWYQEVAAHVLAGARRPRRNVGDYAIADCERAFDDFVGQHDARIGENQFGRHFRQSFCGCGGAVRSRAMNG